MTGADFTRAARADPRTRLVLSRPRAGAAGARRQAAPRPARDRHSAGAGKSPMTDIPRAGLAVILVALLAQAPAHAEPPAEQWTAYSKTAESITGNVTFSPERITFGNGASLPLAPAGKIQDYSTLGRKGTASLFRVTAPADPVLLNGTRLCGGKAPKPVTFIVITRLPPMPPAIPALIAMDAFSGAGPLKQEGGPHSCGNYNFEPAGKR
jgi:hypothetical protein